MSKQINTSKQGLQKFTDLQNREDFKEFRENSTNDEYISYRDYIQPLVNEALRKGSSEVRFLEKYFNCYEYWTEQAWPESKHPYTLKDFKRNRWQVNRLKIEEAIHNFIINQNRLPSNNEIEIETGLSRKTIYKLLKE